MQQNRQTGHWHAFFWALLVSTIIFIPLVIYDHGYFIYYGDFNVQQIPFYQLAHEAVRSGDIFWNWHTDLGANFIGSYSFYLLFSPFFWLTLPFPTSFLPHLMAPLLILKTAVASMTAYFYLRRFLKDPKYAVIGGLLYAFSGWMDFNIFFNHFHDVAAFFPLLLLGLELLVTEDRKGVFAMAVLLNAMVNYWFFIGEVVFTILYVIVRATDKTWGLTPKKFFLIAWEAVLGAGCAAFALFPSAMALMGNPRTSADELLNGWDLWLYWHEQRQPAIIQSWFFPPELPARPNFFPDHGAKWGSLSAWLPLVSVTGVMTYFFQHKKDWLKRILIVCIIFALVPSLNNLFILLNDSYYARWYYMPILLMAMATCRALEDSASGVGDYTRAIKWTAVVLVIFIVICGVTPRVYDDGGELVFGLANNMDMFWAYCAFAMISLAVTSLLVLKLRSNPHFRVLVMVGVMVVSTVFGTFYLANGKYDRERAQWLIDHAIEGRDKISLPDEPFARTDLFDTTDNLSMYWHRPTIQAFHSIVPPSIMDFYPEVGVTRDVASRPETDYYALRPLLSVRWLFIEDVVSDQEPMEGYEFYDNQNDFNIYENSNYLPMGFGYDTYLTREQLQDISAEHRSNMMLRAVVLDSESANLNRDILTPLDGNSYFEFTYDTMTEDVANRRRYTADTFDIDTRGFTATTNFDSPQLLFFSVPWDQGWSASLTSADHPNGIETRIAQANIGFMAVRVPTGPVTIRFNYETPGLREGIYLSAIFVFALILYIALVRLFRKKAPVQSKDESGEDTAALSGKPVSMSWEKYREIYGDGKSRIQRVEQALREAAALRASQLPQEDKTLDFHLSPPESGMESALSDNNPTDGKE